MFSWWKAEDICLFVLLVTERIQSILSPYYCVWWVHVREKGPASFTIFLTSLFSHVCVSFTLPLGGTSCLRKLLKIKWQDRIPDTEVLKKVGMQSVHTLLKLAQLRWTGHVTRMPDERLPKKILYGELQVGKRSHGGQKKWYDDTLKAFFKDFNILTNVGTDCTYRTKWRGLIRRGAGEYETKRIREAEQKRAQRKARSKASPTELSSSDLSCSTCNRQFRAKIGLISHFRTHK